MRRSLLVLGTLLAGLALLPAPQPAQASCAAPYLDRVVALDRGQTERVTGRAFVDGCQDSMGCTVGLGCESCEYDDPPPRPLEDVPLVLVQDGRRWTLGEVDAAAGDSAGQVVWTFELPPGVRRGPARLEPGHSEPVRVRVR